MDSTFTSASPLQETCQPGLCCKTEPSTCFECSQSRLERICRSRNLKLKPTWHSFGECMEYRAMLMYPDDTERIAGFLGQEVPNYERKMTTSNARFWVRRNCELDANGRLCKKPQSKDGEKASKRPQIIPLEHWGQQLVLYHGEKHAGRDKMVKDIQDHNCVPLMKDIITEWISTCPKCMSRFSRKRSLSTDNDDDNDDNDDNDDDDDDDDDDDHAQPASRPTKKPRRGPARITNSKPLATSPSTNYFSSAAKIPQSGTEVHFNTPLKPLDNPTFNNPDFDDFGVPLGANVYSSEPPIPQYLHFDPQSVPSFDPLDNHNFDNFGIPVETNADSSGLLNPLDFDPTLDLNLDNFSLPVDNWDLDSGNWSP